MYLHETFVVKKCPNKLFAPGHLHFIKSALFAKSLDTPALAVLFAFPYGTLIYHHPKNNSDFLAIVWLNTNVYLFKSNRNDLGFLAIVLVDG